jgi:3-isopropylmalate dehydratase small subunit
MEKIFSGKVWKFGDDIDTDTIIRAKYCFLPTFKDMSKHCMELLKPDFASQAQPGDIIVAGKNFGCGSSREQAPASIAALGIKCIIAKSFARIFYRNGINNGMLLVESKEIPDICEDNDIITVEINKGITVKGRNFAVPNIPDNLFRIIQAGGLVEHYKKLNEENEQGGIQ